jgi:hypothetical protein
LWIKDFIRPKQGDQLARPHVLDRVGVARGNVHHANLPIVDRVFHHLAPQDGAEANDGLTLDDAELLDLGVVIMIAARDARLGGRDKNLTGMR